MCRCSLTEVVCVRKSLNLLSTVTARPSSPTAATSPDKTQLSCLLTLSPRHAPPTTRPTMGHCGVCHYLSPVGVKGHTARTCPINQVECRHGLPVGHPFKKVGQCVLGGCIHKETCTSCGDTGHLLGTQKLTEARYSFNDMGNIVRKQNKKALTTADFVCTKMTQTAINTLVANSNNTSTASDHAKMKRRESVLRLIGKVNAARIDVDGTIELMEGMGSDAALLSSVNKPVFKSLVSHAHLGAVEAGKKAAEAAESDVDDEASCDDSAELSVGVEENGGGDGKTEKKGKGKAVYRGPSARRINKYAEAVIKGRRLSKSKAPRKLTKCSEMQTQEVRKSLTASAQGNRASGASGSVVSVPVLWDDSSADVSTRWPSGTRALYSNMLPMFASPVFGAYTPLQVAHLVLEKVTQSPMAQTEMELAGCVVKAAVDRHVRGYTLASGALSAAHVSEWLCSSMPAPMQSAMLTGVAQAILSIVIEFKAQSEAPAGPAARS